MICSADTSDYYIEKCSKATEIQELWERNDSDIYLPPKPDPTSVEQWVLDCWDAWMPCFVGMEYHYHILDWDGDDCIWLPRQEDLQKMVIDPGFEEYWPGGYIALLMHWIGEKPDEKIRQCHSIEQLWLGYVMETNYNLVWKEEIPCKKGEWVYANV